MSKLLGYLCDMNVTSTTAVSYSVTILHYRNLCQMIRWKAQSTNLFPKCNKLLKLTKVSADLAHEVVVAKCTFLREARWTETVINLCIECSLIPMIDSSIHHDDRHSIFTSCLLHQPPFIRYVPILFILL